MFVCVAICCNYCVRVCCLMGLGLFRVQGSRQSRALGFRGFGGFLCFLGFRVVYKIA